VKNQLKILNLIKLHLKINHRKLMAFDKFNEIAFGQVLNFLRVNTIQSYPRYPCHFWIQVLGFFARLVQQLTTMVLILKIKESQKLISL
jgi:hypothetical protein